MKIPFIPDAAPFNEDQKAWLSGFLAGLHSRAAMPAGQAAAATPGGQAVAEAEVTPRLDILFGTQTGSAAALAEDAADVAHDLGFDAHVIGLDDVPMEQLAEMKSALIICSTYGEGEMPDNAQLFWEAVSAGTAPRLEGLSYGVLALGDTSYDEFCHAGKLLDMRLEQLGGKRIINRVDCDVDFDDPAAAWIDAAVLELQKLADTAVTAPAPAADPEPVVEEKADDKPKWGRKNPYQSPLLENRLLSKQGSGKEIRHYSFDLAGSGMTYEVGDALNIIPENAPDLVSLFLDRFGLKGEEKIDDLDMSLADALQRHFEITTPSRDFIKVVAERSKHEEFASVMASGMKADIDAFLYGRDTLDLLHLDSTPVVDIGELLGLLKPLQHRAYSISSSPKAHGEEVHLTVASVRWDRDAREHRGVCSTFIADRLAEGDTASIFLSPNKAFRLPEDDTAPVIMVGPGTGVAPFRAFLFERQQRGATGDNWLFFGDQHRAKDFIYEEEIGAMSADGILTRLDLAFSRDQSEKIYVQNRMRENGKELFEWLEEGGYFYVCGDALRMAKDVDAALHELIAEHGAMSKDEAASYVGGLKREKRYLRDVY